MTRREFLQLTTEVAAAVAIPARLRARSPTEPLSLRNRHFDLRILPGTGLHCRLIHRPSGQVLADGPYSYVFGAPVFDQVRSDRSGLSFHGTTPAGLEVIHRFSLPADAPWLEEEIGLRNPTAKVMSLSPRCGFVLPAKTPGLDEFKFTAVPYRREPLGDRRQYADYSAAQVIHEKRVSSLRGSMKWGHSYSGGVTESGIDGSDGASAVYDGYASEGWIWLSGSTGLLLTKHHDSAMEWSILDRVAGPDGVLALRWGGAGIYGGDPEPACDLKPGASFQFGVTRLTAFSGGIKEGFYTFRGEMDARGYRTPPGFNPPLHWNELYDNKLWWLPHEGFNVPDNRRRYYALADMQVAAGRAREMGCEALYMDPGWDTKFASKIWDETRLGAAADYVRSMQTDYGLKVSLHTPLSGWCDPSTYPLSCHRVDRTGLRDSTTLCGASDAYVDETLRRLEPLGGAGVCYFMFDGTQFSGPCWNPQHGHSVPSTRHEHVAATNRLAVRVHEKYPHVLIEMHDQVIGCVPARYVPTYLGYGKVERVVPNTLSGKAARGFDSVWAFELMWKSMENLIAGNSVCLYYYNLAYSIPLYLHIDLRGDNAEAVMFWWNASTCRHLGVGGTHPDPLVREAQRTAIATYRRLKPYFTAGIFYGIDETTHVHRHPDQPTAVVNCFNLDREPRTREIRFEPASYGLDPHREYRANGRPLSRSGTSYALPVELAGLGHHLIEIA